MSLKTKTNKRQQRRQLSRGLDHATVGAGDITQSLMGLTADTARAQAENLRRRYQSGELAQQLNEAPETLAKEWAAAQEVLAGLPQALQDARQAQRGKSRWKKIAIAAVVVGGGLTVASVVRRSTQPEQPTPQPPNANAQPPA